MVVKPAKYILEIVYTAGITQYPYLTENEPTGSERGSKATLYLDNAI